MTTMENTGKTTTAVKARRSRTRPIVITLVVLAAVLVGADFGSAAIAEYQVSKRARAAFGLANDPAVTVRGFPFLTQAIGGEYDHITVDATGVPVKDTLRDLELHADLRGVQAPLSDLLSGKTDAIVVREIELQVKVKVTDLNRAIQANELPVPADLTNVTIDPASEKSVASAQTADADNPAKEEAELAKETDDSTAGVKVGATVDFAGQQTEIMVFAIVSLNGGKIQVTPKRMELRNSIGSNLVSPSRQQALMPLFAVSLDPGKLPIAVTPTAVKVEPGSLSLTGTAQNVPLSGGTG